MHLNPELLPHIQQVIKAWLVKLDRFNQPAWFQKVYSTCKYTTPGSTPLQRVDVMWGALPEEQTCLWVASIAEVQWEVEQQPEHLLEALIMQLLGSNPISMDAHCKYLEFKLEKNKSLIDGWYQFSHFYVMMENTTTLPLT